MAVDNFTRLHNGNVQEEPESAFGR